MRLSGFPLAFVACLLIACCGGSKIADAQTSAQPVALSPASELKITTERFVIKGLRVGAGPSDVASFLKANGLTLQDIGVKETVQGNKTIQKAFYTAVSYFSNGKQGLEEIKGTLGFTAPFPIEKRVVSCVWTIEFRAHFGEGVSLSSIVEDLEKKYGKAQVSQNQGPDGGVSASWTPRGGTFRAHAVVTPPRDAGAPGELVIAVYDYQFQSEAERRAKEHLDQVDSSRPKDTTKPDF